MQRAKVVLTALALFAALAILIPSFGIAVDRTEVQQDAALDRLNCEVFAEDCATPTVEPTHTMVMPTATTVTATGWHAPGAHDGLNVHEHGDAPPAWVLDSANQPFTQSRESHTGYKGIVATSSTGVQSYLITHILSTVMARSHGDHDYQLWVRDPQSGAVFYWAGVLDFGNPPPLRTVDTGERPIILGERTATDGCETWYQRPGVLVFDLGWTICDRNQKFDGTVLGGVGTFRSADWVIPCDRLTGAARTALLDNCRVEFGVSRMTWLVTGKQFPRSGVQPVN